MPWIEVDKKSRHLILYGPEGEILFHCPVALGKCPTGHKRAEGDGRTPEGEYCVCTRNPNSKYHLSLGLSYPNAADAREAFSRGQIAQDVLDAILSAQEKGVRPPWDTPLGGFIMIHGGGAQQDWTAGCIALSDADMDRLWALCPLGTRVVIRGA